MSETNDTRETNLSGEGTCPHETSVHVREKQDNINTGVSRENIGTVLAKTTLTLGCSGFLKIVWL